MILVGSRPNVRRETDLYTEIEKDLFAVKPGITDFASIILSDEGEILADKPDPDIAYRQLIRPWKSRLGLFYIRKSKPVARPAALRPDRARHRQPPGDARRRRLAAREVRRRGRPGGGRAAQEAPRALPAARRLGNRDVARWDGLSGNRPRSRHPASCGNLSRVPQCLVGHYLSRQ